MGTGLYFDYFDQELGLHLTNTGSNTEYTLKGEVGYELSDDCLNVAVSYKDKILALSGKFYLDKGNPGVVAKYTHQIDKNNKINMNAAYFKDDAAFEINLRTQLPDKSKLSIGAYGSTGYKQVGVRACWSFYFK